MNRVLILAAVLALTGFRASAGPVTLGTFAVNPQASFLYESANDSNVSALFIALTCPMGVTTDCVNATPGETLQIIGLGTFCYGPANCPPEVAASLAGIFDSNNILLNSSSLPAGDVDRLTGTMNAGAPSTLVFHNPYLNAYYGNVDTTIPNDFFIPTGTGLTVVIPNGATYLVVGVLDSYYADDTDPSGTLAVEIIGNQNAAPEPASFSLFAAGIVGLVAFRYYRSR